jgi:glycosyltransferase involved in cell wall biosynthesis
VVVRPGPNSPLTIWWPQRYADFRGVDVFHGPQNLLPRDLPCASVITVHDLMAIEAPHLYLKGIERLVRRAYYPQALWGALRHATRIIAQSHATADRIIALVPAAAKRIRVIMQGTESGFRPPDDLAAAQLQVTRLIGGDWPYLLVVGANTATKRHDLAIAAFAAAVPAPYRLVLLQRRLRSQSLLNLARRLGVDGRVMWLEALAPNEVIELLQCARVLVQPSVYEGFGLPVLEAMACGCPVVASDIPPFREITEGAALLVPPNDLEQLAVALRDVVVSAELRASLREQGLVQAKKFSWDRCARETLAVYHEAAAR